MIAGRMEIFQKTPYPPEYAEMERIKRLLECGICHDFIETTVMTPCSHNYCSLCIRKYLHYKPQCPACFQTTFEKDLRTNRILDEIIIHFVKIRAKLVGCNAGADKDVTTDNCFKKSKNPQSTKPSIATNSSVSQSVTVGTFNIADKPPVIGSISGTGTVNISNETFLSSVLCASSTTSDKTIDDISDDYQLDNGKVSCPICLVELSPTHINKHLDECTKRESIQEECHPRPDHTRKLLPKLVFNLMKDSELKKKMKQLNLPTQGDRRTLENRFQRYCTLYNAESDKRNPRPIEALLEQCKTEEFTERKLAKSSLGMNSFKMMRNAEQSVIDKMNEKYIKVNDQSYQQLIESIRSRQERGDPDYYVKPNDDTTLTCMHNTEDVQTCYQPVSPQSHHILYDHPKQSSSNLRTADSNGIMGNQYDPIEELENVDEDEKCSLIDGSVATCGIENRELQVLENDMGDQAVCKDTLCEQTTVQLPYEISQPDKHIDINDTENSSQCLTSIDSTIKRRRRRNCDSSIVKVSWATHTET